MKVEVVRAGSRTHESQVVEVQAGATVADAIAASGIDATGIAGQAVFGRRVDGAWRVEHGDRVELLGPLRVDPKEARRRRAGVQREA